MRWSSSAASCSMSCPPASSRSVTSDCSPTTAAVLAVSERQDRSRRVIRTYGWGHPGPFADYRLVIESVSRVMARKLPRPEGYGCLRQALAFGVAAWIFHSAPSKPHRSRKKCTRVYPRKVINCISYTAMVFSPNMHEIALQSEDDIREFRHISAFIVFTFGSTKNSLVF